MPAVSIPAGAVAVPAQPDPAVVEIVPEAAGRLSRGARQTVAVGILAVIALVAALFGFGGIAASAAGIAKILFVVFLIAFAVSGILSLARRGGHAV